MAWAVSLTSWPLGVCQVASTKTTTGKRPPLRFSFIGGCPDIRSSILGPSAGSKLLYHSSMPAGHGIHRNPEPRALWRPRYPARTASEEKQTTHPGHGRESTHHRCNPTYKAL